MTDISILEQFPPSMDDDHETYCNQFQNYLDEKITPEANFNLVNWWEAHQQKYPELFKLFLKYSFIPATSSMVESEFSYTGLVINDRRSSLKPQNVNDIMIARNNCYDFFSKK